VTKKRRVRIPFIDDEASVGEEDEEEEEEEEDDDEEDEDEDGVDISQGTSTLQFLLGLGLSADLVARGLTSGNRLPFECGEDFHAEALRRVERYHQVNPRKVIEDASMDEPSLGHTLRLPANHDAGLWRVHVKVSELWP
jgi:hypothetical protein